VRGEVSPYSARKKPSFFKAKEVGQKRKRAPAPLTKKKEPIPSGNQEKTSPSFKLRQKREKFFPSERRGPLTPRPQKEELRKGEPTEDSVESSHHPTEEQQGSCLGQRWRQAFVGGKEKETSEQREKKRRMRKGRGLITGRDADAQKKDASHVPGGGVEKRGSTFPNSCSLAGDIQVEGQRKEGARRLGALAKTALGAKRRLGGGPIFRRRGKVLWRGEGGGVGPDGKEREGIDWAALGGGKTRHLRPPSPYPALPASGGGTLRNPEKEHSFSDGLEEREAVRETMEKRGARISTIT